MPLTDNYIFELDENVRAGRWDLCPEHGGGRVRRAHLEEFFTENLASPSYRAVRELVG